MILNDKDIRDLCLRHDPPMITPFSEAVKGGGVISYGLSAAGYDIRLGPDFRIFKGSYCEFSDPKRMSDENYLERMFDKIYETSGPVRIPANGYLLASSLEYFHVPDYVQGHCFGKSTLARTGIIVNVTPLEPAWFGHLTIEISNAGPCPAVVYAGEGIAQIVFHQLTSVPETTYADKKGKYQGQTGVTVARVL